MSKTKRKPPFVSQMLARLAERAGVEVHLEPEYGHIGQIICPNGRIHYFRRTHLDLNPLGAAELAGDKDFAAYFMRRLGYSTIPARKFYSDQRCRQIGSRLDMDAAIRYAATRLPVLVKPNSRSQGVGVSVAHTPDELMEAGRVVFEKDNVLLVQKWVRGRDYRVVVLDGEVISAYERIPLNVVGDGRLSIGGLLARKQRKFDEAGRDTRIAIDDPRIGARLARAGLTLRSRPAQGQRIQLLDSANLSSGGDAVDMTSSIHEDYRTLAVSLTRDMGLRYAGVDLMIPGGIDRRRGRHWVIEINAAPGLDNYAAGSEEQEMIVEGLYLKVLEAIKRL